MDKDRMSRWISVEEGLPLNGQPMLVFNGDMFIASKCSKTSRWIDVQGFVRDDVTHWRELPFGPDTRPPPSVEVIGFESLIVE